MLARAVGKKLIRSVNNSVFEINNGGVFRYWYRTAMCINIRLFSHQIFTATYVRKDSRLAKSGQALKWGQASHSSRKFICCGATIGARILSADRHA